MAISTNPFDQACRYLAKLDPTGFVVWLMRISAERFRFVRWLDTRQIVFPGEPDRACDTVAQLENPDRGGEPWAVPIEFSIEPDPRMFGRLLVYSGSLWLEARPGENRGDRFSIGAAIVNLTGRGNSSRSMEWPEAGLATISRIVERNLANESASQTLTDIKDGRIAPIILPFVPLMRDGGESAIVREWLTLASAESDSARRGDYGGLALVFAEAADRGNIWKPALKGWNVMQSKQVLEWQADSALKARQSALLEALGVRFGPADAKIREKVEEVSDSARLSGLLVIAIRCSSLDEFRKELGL